LTAKDCRILDMKTTFPVRLFGGLMLLFASAGGSTESYQSVSIGPRQLGVVAGLSSAVSSEAPLYDLVFDGENADRIPQLYRVALDGSSPRLIGGGIVGTQPRPRADGTALIFNTVGDARHGSQLMLLDNFNLQPERLSLSRRAEREAGWSPDGRRIVFQSRHFDDGGDILVATLNGRRLEEVQNLTPKSEGYTVEPDVTPVWSPDGTQIAFTSYRSGSAAIWVMNADGSRARQVTVGGAYNDYFPSWSPDGRSLAFQRADRANAQIGVVALDGSAPRFLSFPGQAYAPAWSPDGVRLAFAGNVGGEQDIYVMRLDNQQLMRIARSGRDDGPAWIRRL
jgi:Tol biopolymer transport system component